MSRSVPQNYSTWTMQQLMEYSIGCADALKQTRKPSERKRLHKSIERALQAIGDKLGRHPSYIYAQKIIA